MKEFYGFKKKMWELLFYTINTVYRIRIKEVSDWNEGREQMCLAINGQVYGIRVKTAEGFRWPRGDAYDQVPQDSQKSWGDWLNHSSM